MATTSQRPTNADLLALPRVGKHEVVDGDVRVTPASWAHEEIVARIIYELSAHVRANRLGTVLGSNTLYCLPGGNQRAPDVSFEMGGHLDGHDVLPGLRCALEDVLPSPGMEQFQQEPGGALQDFSHRGLGDLERRTASSR